jgi:hypothetical protein
LHPAQLERRQPLQPSPPETALELPFGPPLRPKKLDTSRCVRPEPQAAHLGAGPSLRRDVSTSNFELHLRH